MVNKKTIQISKKTLNLLRSDKLGEETMEDIIFRHRVNSINLIKLLNKIPLKHIKSTLIYKELKR